MISICNKNIAQTYKIALKIDIYFQKKLVTSRKKIEVTNK